ncbi:MAG: hypothetical protein PHQ05_10215 [Sterolibacterium sp.]|nr:hypothetical protein [Sterolibacterium sp.]
MNSHNSTQAQGATASVMRKELLFTAALLRAQVMRLRAAALRSDGDQYRIDMESAADLERRAEQMEKEAEHVA